MSEPAVVKQSVQQDIPPYPHDLTQDVLTYCGGRLTLPDAELLYKTPMEIKAKNMLEIGSMDGCSSMVLGEVARTNDGLLQCLEPAPKQKWRWNIERLNLQKYVDLIFASSPWIPPEKVNTPLDYLLIDGDHRTRWCLVDYHYWFPFVRVGGRIAFHDWNERREAGVWVREAVRIILETDSEYLNKLGETQGSTRGLVVFEKIKDINRYR